MKKWLERLEYYVDRVIPYTLVVLVVLIVLEIFFHDELGPYILIVKILDYIIIAIFIVDLYFKYQRVKNFKLFLRKYWLDVIAVFPFFLVFRMFEEVLILSGGLKETFLTSQKVVHSGVEVEKIGAKFVETASREARVLQGIEREGMQLIREAEQVGKISRTEAFARVFSPIERVTRISKFASKDTEKNLEKEIENKGEKIQEEILKGEEFAKKEERKAKRLLKKEETKVKKELKKVEEKVEGEIKKVPRIVNAFVFYERPKKHKKKC